MEHESKQIQESGLTEETDEESKEEYPPGGSVETSNVCDTNMDLSETDRNTEIIVSTCATNTNFTSEEELSPEEIRAQEYLAKKAAQGQKDSKEESSETTTTISSEDKETSSGDGRKEEGSTPSQSAVAEGEEADSGTMEKVEDSCDKCSASEEAGVLRQGEENAENICTPLEQSTEDTKAICDSVDQNKSNNKEDKEVHIHSDLPIDDFNSFTFWRDPLPEVSLDLEVMSDNQDVEQGGRGMRKPTENECETINSSLSLTNSMNTPVSATNQLYGESGVRIHTASISTVSEESVSNIGSTHVLGQNLNEVMDGVVHGMCILQLEFNLLSQNSRYLQH